MDLCTSLGRLLKTIFHQKTINEKQVSSQLEEVDSSSKFIWKIENFSKLNPNGYYSDVFTVGGCTWKVMLSPENDVYDNYFVVLKLVEGRPSADQEFRLVVNNQTEISKECTTPQLLHLSELCNPDKGCLVNDACIVEFRVSCSMKQGGDHDGKEPPLDGGSKVESEPEASKSNGESREYPCAGQPFEEISADNYNFFRTLTRDEEDDHEDGSNSEDNSEDDSEDECGGTSDSEDGSDPEDDSKDECGGISEDGPGDCLKGVRVRVGGFHIFYTQASSYEKIWMKYGHIGTTKVIPVSWYPTLVLAVTDVMDCIMDMHRCRFVEISAERIEDWEEKIKRAEKFEFNISWLRERFETVKKSFGGMQKFKTELLEHGQLLRSAKSKMEAVEDELKKARVELITAEDSVRKNMTGLLSESDMEMYLEIGENLLLDGMF